jgi:hypothetical protein
MAGRTDWRLARPASPSVAWRSRHLRTLLGETSCDRRRPSRHWRRTISVRLWCGSAASGQPPWQLHHALPARFCGDAPSAPLRTSPAEWPTAFLTIVLRRDLLLKSAAHTLAKRIPPERPGGARQWAASGGAVDGARIGRRAPAGSLVSRPLYAIRAHGRGETRSIALEQRAGLAREPLNKAQVRRKRNQRVRWPPSHRHVGDYAHKIMLDNSD